MNKVATISYIPSIHGGYIDFLKKYPYPLYILAKDFLNDIPKLDRDVRVMEPAEVVQALSSLDIAASVKILDRESLDDLATFNSVIMPDEDANRTFAKNHLEVFSSIAVRYIPTFLRWDMKASLQTLPVEDEAVPASKEELAIMNRVREEANKSPDWWRQVGSMVITKNGRRLLGHNTHLPSPDYSLNTFGDPRSNFDAGDRIEISKAIHAEAYLIAAAAKEGQSLDGATLYVSTFPCPQCAKLIAMCGIKSVLYDQGYSLLDAQDTLRASGVSLRRLA